MPNDPDILVPLTTPEQSSRGKPSPRRWKRRDSCQGVHAGGQRDPVRGLPINVMVRRQDLERAGRRFARCGRNRWTSTGTRWMWGP